MSAFKIMIFPFNGTKTYVPNMLGRLVKEWRIVFFQVLEIKCNSVCKATVLVQNHDILTRVHKWFDTCSVASYI